MSAEFFEPVLVITGLIAGWTIRSWRPVPLLAVLWGLIVGGQHGSLSLEAIRPDIVIGFANVAVGVATTKGWRAMFWEPRRPAFPRVSRSVS